MIVSMEILYVIRKAQRSQKITALLFLVKSLDHVLEERLYSFEEEVTPNALEAVASRLRRKLRESGADCRMETVRGLGYRMSPASSEERAGRGRTGGRRI